MIGLTVTLKLVKRQSFDFKSMMRKDIMYAGIFQTLAIFSTIQMTFKIDYLFNVLFRSSKFLSVMFGSLIFKSDGHENISYVDLSWGLVLTLGVFVFNMGSNNKGNVIYSIEGFIFGFLSLIFDSFVSHFQLNSKKKQKLTYLDFTLAMNIFIFLSNLVLALLTRELEESFSFVIQHPSVIWHILPQQMLLVCGLMIIFYHLHLFGPVSVAYIATIRKLFTITFSIMIFNHPMNTFHQLGLAIVLIVIAVDFKRTLDKKKKVTIVKKNDKIKKD